MGRFGLAVVIPAYNEQNTIEQVVSRVIEYGQPIVVNDASTDSTGKNAKAAGAIVVDHKKQLGYDQALNSGFAKANGLGFTHVVTLDADGQHEEERIADFIECFKAGYDLVLGVRSIKARVSELLFAVYTKSRYQWLDPLCGMKGYKLTLYNQHGTFTSYPSIGTELALYALKNGIKFTQVNISIRKRGDKSRFHGVFKANIIILKSLYYHILGSEY